MFFSTVFLSFFSYSSVFFFVGTMEFNALIWAKAQDGQWHRGTVISREETGDLRHIKVCVYACVCVVGTCLLRLVLGPLRCCCCFWIAMKSSRVRCTCFCAV